MNQEEFTDKISRMAKMMLSDTSADTLMYYLSKNLQVEKLDEKQSERLDFLLFLWRTNLELFRKMVESVKGQVSCDLTYLELFLLLEKCWMFRGIVEKRVKEYRDQMHDVIGNA